MALLLIITVSVWQPWWDLPLGSGCLWVLCVCSLSFFLYVRFGCNNAMEACVDHITPVPSGQHASLMVNLCSSFFLLTYVMIFGEFSPCCHITIPHWNALILTLVQLSCGDWANIELCCQTTPASLRERREVELYCGQSKRKIKVEQTVKCMWVCSHIHFDYKYTYSAQQCTTPIIIWP